jgi:gluconate kinase
MGTAVVIYGPKGAGKSYLARMLERELGIHHIDPDALVLRWIEEKGMQPDQKDGWLQNLVESATNALRTRNVISIEATGAWDSDWKLPALLKDAGHDVITIRLLIDRATAMTRLSTRKEARVPVSASEADRIWKEADVRRRTQTVDLEIDAAGSDFGKRVVCYIREKLRP